MNILEFTEKEQILLKAVRGFSAWIVTIPSGRYIDGHTVPSGNANKFLDIVSKCIENEIKCMRYKIDLST